MANKLPFETQGRTSVGGLWGVTTLKSLGKLPNGSTDWHQIWYTSVDSYGNGHRLKQIAPRYPRAAFWGGGVTGSTIQKTGKCYQTAGPIGNIFCTYNANESGNGHVLNKLAP